MHAVQDTVQTPHEGSRASQGRARSAVLAELRSRPLPRLWRVVRRQSG